MSSLLFPFRLLISPIIFHIMRKIKYDIKETHGNNSRKNIYNFCKTQQWYGPFISGCTITHIYTMQYTYGNSIMTSLLLEQIIYIEFIYYTGTHFS